ncbi:MAG: cytochrome c biogenesis heme-transporting ATPase CcmA [Woeseia sp.]
MVPLLSASSLALLRGERLLFRNVNFALNAGDALLIEGANGSGKTSLLRVIAGLLDPEEGEVAWRGNSIRQQRQTYCGNLVWYGHLSGCKRDLTLLENLRCEQSLRPQKSVTFATVITRLGLDDLVELPVRALSAGQQRRVALARLLLSAAPLWLLDEPLTNLDRAGQQLVTDMLSEHLAAGGLSVMASHHGVAPDLPVQRLTLS